jgi:hypothetical protein
MTERCIHCGCELRTEEEKENHVCANCFGALCDETNAEDARRYEEECLIADADANK